MRHERHNHTIGVPQWLTRLRPVRPPLLLFACVVAAAAACGGSEPERQATPTNGLTATLAVELFNPLDSAPKGWVPAAFAESLTTHLGRVRGLAVHVSGGNAPEFTLRGDVTERGGRLMISPRLWRTGEKEPVWTATFWRSHGSMSNLVEDISTGAAEALYSDIARRSISTTKERQ